jgi:hypothetical protein
VLQPIPDITRCTNCHQPQAEHIQFWLQVIKHDTYYIAIAERTAFGIVVIHVRKKLISVSSRRQQKMLDQPEPQMPPAGAEPPNAAANMNGRLLAVNTDDAKSYHCSPFELEAMRKQGLDPGAASPVALPRRRGKLTALRIDATLELPDRFATVTGQIGQPGNIHLMKQAPGAGFGIYFIH